MAFQDPCFMADAATRLSVCGCLRTALCDRGMGSVGSCRGNPVLCCTVLWRKRVIALENFVPMLHKSCQISYCEYFFSDESQQNSLVIQIQNTETVYLGAAVFLRKSHFGQWWLQTRQMENRPQRPQLHERRKQTDRQTKSTAHRSLEEEKPKPQLGFILTRMACVKMKSGNKGIFPLGTGLFLKPMPAFVKV